MILQIARLIAACLLALSASPDTSSGFQENRRAAYADAPVPDDVKVDLLASGAPQFKVIAEMFSQFMADWQAKDVDRLADHFYFDRILQELRSQRVFEGLGLDDADVAAFIEGVKPTMGWSLVNSPMLRLNRHEIRSIQLAANGREARVIVRHSSSDGVRGYVRWWLVEVENRWRIFDMEDLDSGVRVSTGAVVTGAHLIRTQKLDEVRDSLRELTRLVPMLFDGKFDEVEAGLERLTDRELPPLFDAMRWIMLASSKIGLVEPEEALACIERASTLRADMPVLDLLRAAAYNMADKPDRAVLHAQKYLEVMGHDAEAFLHLGDALAALEQPDAAADAYRKGLADNPESIENLIGLGHVLPKERKKELGDHFVRFASPAELIEPLGEEFFDDADTLAVLVEAFRKVAPDDVNVALYGGRELVLREQFADAATMLRAAIERARDGDKRNELTESYLDAMIHMKKSLEGYESARDARHAFRYVAQWLTFDEDSATLRKLIDSHAKSHANDRWLLYYSGEAYLIDGMYDDAETAFALGMAQTTRELDREDFRERRVFARFKSGRGLSAYDDIGPRKETFDQLAELFFGAGNADDLGKLVVAQRARDPDDADLPRWDVDVLWLRKDYATALAQLRSGEREFLDDEQGDVFWFMDRLVRALVRLGKHSDAVAAATSRSVDDFDTVVLVLAHAAAGDVEQTIKTFEQALKEGYDLSDLYEDEDLGPVLRSEKFRDLREKHPPPTVEIP
jgi:tetratricopeptide (TPR) repeat protein